MTKRAGNLLSGLLSLLFIGFLACKKTAPPKLVITPLQTLVNTDTTLTLFHRMILQANDAALLNDAASPSSFHAIPYWCRPATRRSSSIR